MSLTKTVSWYSPITKPVAKGYEYEKGAPENIKVFRVLIYQIDEKHSENVQADETDT